MGSHCPKVEKAVSHLIGHSCGAAGMTALAALPDDTPEASRFRVIFCWGPGIAPPAVSTVKRQEVCKLGRAFVIGTKEKPGLCAQRRVSQSAAWTAKGNWLFTAHTATTKPMIGEYLPCKLFSAFHAGRVQRVGGPDAAAPAGRAKPPAAPRRWPGAGGPAAGGPEADGEPRHDLFQRHPVGPQGAGQGAEFGRVGGRHREERGM